MKSESSSQSPETEVPCSTFLKVLGDETRLKVVQILFNGPLHVSALMEQLGIEQSLLSHHLRILREAGIVMHERDGKSVLYRLTPGIESRQKADGLDFECCELSFSKSKRK